MNGHNPSPTVQLGVGGDRVCGMALSPLHRDSLALAGWPPDLLPLTQLFAA